MRLADFDLNLLLAFEALLAERSVTLASRRLGIGQPAASAALARLRGLLHDPLFLRGPEGMRPTPRALELAPGIAAALAELRRTLEPVARFDPAVATRRFALASTDYTSLVLLPTVAAAIGRAAPGVDLQVVGYAKDDVPALLARGALDAALGVFPEPPGAAVMTPLFAEAFVGVARVGHPALVDGAVALPAFCAASHVLVTTRRDRTGEVDAALSARGLVRRVALTVPHMLALLGVVAESDLVGAVPMRVAARLARPMGLAVFTLPVAVATWRVTMLWPAAAREDQGAAWLRGVVREAASRIDAAMPGQSGGVATQPGPRRVKDATRAARISKVTEHGGGSATTG
ncbi:LysR substrate-binding domain-containing protein [Roseomonas fluvialis]|uniref:LysR family transcriptional regulator n=1 Tax=Roseomonas fluvialis TaxID=1750527 RepID=A0ABM7Y6H7_9PROT|nr:LysR substrate-binding domain-containing protein [Roseomonas fluvialis]BDG73531.1 LysR family transcriptional regulator [Roseomonas fluvialis]